MHHRLDVACLSAMKSAVLCGAMPTPRVPHHSFFPFLLVLDRCLQSLIVSHQIAATIRGPMALVTLLPCFNLGETVLLGRLVAIDAQELFHRHNLW